MNFHEMFVSACEHQGASKRREDAWLNAEARVEQLQNDLDAERSKSDRLRDENSQLRAMNLRQAHTIKTFQQEYENVGSLCGCSSGVVHDARRLGE